jgi:hypothetical protein
VKPCIGNAGERWGPTHDPSCLLTDVIVIAPGIGPLALSPESLRAALKRGRELLGEPVAEALATADASPTLVSAEVLAQRSGVPASWWMAQARERRVPFRKIGRRVRFDPMEALGCEAFTRKAIPARSAGYENR